MPNIPGADARQSRTLQSLDRFTPDGINALAAVGLVLAEAVNDARLIINASLPAGERSSTRSLIDRMYDLQDALHGDSSKLPEALAVFLSTVEEACHDESTPTKRPSIDSSVYGIALGAKAADAHELIEKKLAHLDAMLMMTWGIGGATFGTLLDEYAQDNYLWACSEMASEIRQLFGLMRVLP